MSTPSLFSDRAQFTPRQRAWAFLSRMAHGPNAALIRALYSEPVLDPVTLAKKIIHNDPDLPDALRNLPDLPDPLTQPLEDLTDATSHRIRLVTPDDEEWPREAFAKAFGNPITTPTDPDKSHLVMPVALWVAGQSLSTLRQKPMAAVVGTRASTTYGDTMAKEITRDLLRAGHSVVTVSNGFGISSAVIGSAVQTCRENPNNAGPIVVTANGLDYTYPQVLAPLEHAIRSHGAYVSEYPCGVLPNERQQFLDRNRIVAALADTTVLVEGHTRNGCSHTAKIAACGMDKPICAVPGNVTNPGSKLPNQLIRTGWANLVDSGDEVIRVMENTAETTEIAEALPLVTAR